MRRYGYAMAVMVTGLMAISIGCEEEPESPVEQFEQSMDEAEESIQGAEKSLSAMRERGEELAESVEQRQAAVQELVEKQLALLDQQFEQQQARVARLPAGTETTFRARLNELAAKRNQAGQLLEQYAAATGAQATQIKTRLDNLMEELESAYEEFAADLRDAHAAE